ncbi:NNMT/PNMT/TEMT family protein [Necator americanus]|uniref:NNMT/PNMT/TEMT family protein n=1 Tax=Necator americanus TaxID=51031 RepID=W2T996_NECAM|nr:NNMT/PNMT/TEMT family protein [Necator americanus]ETN77562.1 NNMT/PNMT/TEMT family protein [Necator americanus]
MLIDKATSASTSQIIANRKEISREVAALDPEIDAVVTSATMIPISDAPPQEPLDRDSFLTEFKTEAYLEDFYSKVEDSAMKMMLGFLPIIVARIGRVAKVLDFGAGPTIHVAASFRNVASEIYLADYLPQNRRELDRWREGKSDFDWSDPLKRILTQEGNSWDDLDEMIELTRKKVVVSILCVEYCCKTLDEYRRAIKNIGEQIKPGGFLVIGGIFEETWCAFGGRTFTCLYITKENMLSALEDAGLRLENDRKCILYEYTGMYMVCARKVAGLAFYADAN